MDLADALRDYSDYGSDIAGSGPEDVENNLRRFVSLFSSDQPLGEIAGQLLPPVPFDDWYAKCEATGGSMAGSSTLDWPVPRREKVALQLELLRRIASGKIGIYDFCYQFCYGGGDFQADIFKFVGQVFVSFHRDFLRTVESAAPRPDPPRPVSAERPNLIDEERLDEIRRLQPTRVDFTRLVRLCEELNTAYRHECFHAVALLTRAIMDHIPPIFALHSFSEVANNYNGTRSFKEAMDHLQNSARKIADQHLHTPIRSREVLPNATQVNFSNNLDVLLSEIVRISK